MNTSSIYLSPNGNDEWSGRLPEADATGADGPLRTLKAAQAAVRKLKSGLREPAEIRVELRGGVYELDEPLRFHPEDGGFGRTSNRLAKTWPVTWAAYRGETPVISGGRRIAGPWQKETINGVTVYTCQPPAELLEADGFTQLWINGSRRKRPQLPKRGLWQVERGIDSDFSVWGHAHPSNACVYKAGQLSANWRHLNDVQLHFYGWWIDRHVKIRAIDEDARTVHFDRTAKLRMEWSPGDGVDYVAENVFEALTEPGEWYVDRAEGKLYVIPLPGEDIAAAEVVAAELPQLMTIDRGGFLHFEGLVFAHCEWSLPADQAGDMQAAAHVPAAIAVRGAEGCEFRNCRIEHVNTYGVELLDGTVEICFEGCTLTDLGAGGVRIWHGCRRNALLDCEIGPGGLVFAAACGVLIGKATGNRVEHCHIHDFYYTGISAGWNWGYAESDGYGNIFEWNHIHHLGKGLLSDMGGIYLLGHAAGTRLRFNHIHDIDCRRYGGWCMYTDEGSTDVLMESNLCYRANRDAFHQHYGRNNTLRNNILAYGGDAVLAYGKPEAHLGLVFDRNILLSREAPILRGASPDRWTPEQTRFERNLYWCEIGTVAFERGRVAYYATQPFPDGFQAEASRFAPLGNIPAARETPSSEVDWRDAYAVTRFSNALGTATAPDGLAELRFLMHDDELLVRARLQRPANYNPMQSDSLWNREHVELFLKPFPDRSGMVQLGVDSSGEAAALWHDCEAPDGFAMDSRVDETNHGWQCIVSLPIAALAAQVGAGKTPDWQYLAGFAVPPELGDFASWQAQGHDPDGIVADPHFVDPVGGDFRLRDDSPVFALGFVPWPIEQSGPRPSHGQ